MFLKRMETIGFKSFAERIKVNFVSGVTAVVGPNGSGKSNVIDAIRWVLGEQSAKSIRGQKMEDIIFQGSETRKALNFAEVSLILNNEAAQLPIDYEEVNVTRRVYRSGESEFFLNKQACRLKDIIELFMDTGLGKESFSIIGQGRIDEILSSKAEERRAVFEEAAGVLKYKQRKKKAEFKLMETSDNLDRVEDILYEITDQLGPLEQQANTAKKYQTLQQELKTTETALLVTEIEHLHGEWQNVLKEIEASQSESIQKKTAIQQTEAVLTKNREQIDKLEKEMTELQGRLLELTEQLEKNEGRRNVLVEQSKHEQANKESLKEQERRLEERLKQFTQIESEENAQLQEINAEISELKERIQTLECELHASPQELEEKLEGLKSEYIDQLNEQAVIKNELERLDVQISQSNARQENRNKTYDELQEEKSRLEKEEQTYTNKVDELKMELELYEEKRKSSLRQLDEERAKLESMQQQFAAGNERIAKLTSRKEMLEEMKDSYQGFYHGAKEILQAKSRGRITGIFGAVLDLIRIPGDYMAAMETVLGAQGQYIVVQHDEAARNCINWLKQQNKGRATFLPLNSIKPKYFPKSLKEKLNHEPGFIGVAADLIQTESTFDQLKAYLLGNVLVTENMQHANRIADTTSRKFRVVTLDGDIVFPGGSMSGGARKDNRQSLFSREKEIEELSEKIKKLKWQATTYDVRIKKQKETLQYMENEQAMAVKEAEKTKKELDDAQRNLHEISLACSRTKAEVENDQTIREQYQRERESFKKRKSDLHEKQADILLSISTTKSEIEKLSFQKSAVEQDEKKSASKLQQLKIRQAEQKERKRAVMEKYQETQAQYKESSTDLDDIRKELVNMMDEQERKDLKKSLETEIKHLGQSRKKTTLSLQDTSAHRNELIQQVNDEEQEIKGMQYTLDTFNKSLQQKEVQANRLDVTLENHLNRLQDTYKITYERARKEYENVADTTKAKRQVEVLHTSIERLGNVNLGAISEYTRLSERETFLREQQNDLLTAKETLYNVIQEMDDEMTKRFSEVFGEIQLAFSDVFETLFGGGQATLTMTDPENMLETGIDINARPPGKKLKTLELLSGGERALTAIALLFAILHVRPVPFCILDEVDAALDEANIERFGSYLQSFSKETQFIVITHRQGTMEQADALYGVTMQESGVSRLVSVKLEEAKPLVGTT